MVAHGHSTYNIELGTIAEQCHCRATYQRIYNRLPFTGIGPLDSLDFEVNFHEGTDREDLVQLGG